MPSQRLAWRRRSWLGRAWRRRTWRLLAEGARAEARGGRGRPMPSLLAARALASWRAWSPPVELAVRARPAPAPAAPDPIAAAAESARRFQRFAGPPEQEPG